MSNHKTVTLRRTEICLGFHLMSSNNCSLRSAADVDTRYKMSAATIFDNVIHSQRSVRNTFMSANTPCSSAFQLFFVNTLSCVFCEKRHNVLLWTERISIKCLTKMQPKESLVCECAILVWIASRSTDVSLARNRVKEVCADCHRRVGLDRYRIPISPHVVPTHRPEFKISSAHFVL